MGEADDGPVTQPELRRVIREVNEKLNQVLTKELWTAKNEVVELRVKNLEERADAKDKRDVEAEKSRRSDRRWLIGFFLAAAATFLVQLFGSVIIRGLGL